MAADLLLRDQRADPTMFRNAALREALQRECMDVVIFFFFLLLAGRRIQLGLAKEAFEEVKALLLKVYKKAMNSEDAVLSVVNHKTALFS